VATGGGRHCDRCCQQSEARATIRRRSARDMPANRHRSGRDRNGEVVEGLPLLSESLRPPLQASPMSAAREWALGMQLATSSDRRTPSSTRRCSDIEERPRQPRPSRPGHRRQLLRHLWEWDAELAPTSRSRSAASTGQGPGVPDRGSPGASDQSTNRHDRTAPSDRGQTARCSKSARGPWRSPVLVSYLLTLAARWAGIQGPGEVAVCTKCPSMPVAGIWLPAWTNAVAWRRATT
jgi:hypothetical protein